jgi:hypothetical protein
LSIIVQTGKASRGRVGSEEYYTDYTYYGSAVNEMFKLLKHSYPDQVIATSEFIDSEGLPPNNIIMTYIEGERSNIPGLSDVSLDGSSRNIKLFWPVRVYTNREKKLDKRSLCCDQCTKIKLCADEYKHGIEDMQSGRTERIDTGIESGRIKPWYLEYAYRIGYYRDSLYTDTMKMQEVTENESRAICCPKCSNNKLFNCYGSAPLSISPQDLLKGGIK